MAGHDRRAGTALRSTRSRGRPHLNTAAAHIVADMIRFYRSPAKSRIAATSLQREGIRMLSATVRDLAIIIVAIQSIVLGVLIAVLIWQIWRLVSMIQTEVKPLIDDTQATVNTVRGTTTFVTDHVAAPVIHASGEARRWRRTFQALTRDLYPGNSGKTSGPPGRPRRRNLACSVGIRRRNDLPCADIQALRRRSKIRREIIPVCRGQNRLVHAVERI